MDFKEYILWGILLLQIIIFPIHLYLDPDSNIASILLSIPGIGTLLHATWTLNLRRGLIFLALASLTGFIFEFIGLNYGIVFGGYYLYNPRSLSFLGVPLTVIAFWAIFIYTGYSIMNSFLYWLNLQKPNMRNNKLLNLLLLILLDGLVVVSIDLFMDPIMVAEGRWTWISEGGYFGVPFGNFLGWFTVAIISSGIFRTYEYFHPVKSPAITRSVYFIPVIAYCLLYISFLISAVQYRMFLLTLIGTVVMLPTILINSWLFWRFVINSPRKIDKIYI